MLESKFRSTKQNTRPKAVQWVNQLNAQRGHQRFKAGGGDNYFAEILHQLRFYPKKRFGLFSKLPPILQARALLLLTERLQRDILAKLSDKSIVELLEFMDPDEGVDVLRCLPKHQQRKVIQRLRQEKRDSLEFLSSFDPQTAAGLMSTDYIQVDETDSFAQVADQFKVHEQRTGRPPVILTLQVGKLSGFLPGYQLGLRQPQEPIKAYIKKIQTIRHNASQHEVLQLFKTHPHDHIVVLGDSGQVMGIIYSDELLRLLKERASAALYDFAGVSEEESVIDTTTAKVKFRYKWLILNLGTGFLAALIIGLFESTISQFVILAVYMPIVAGMGGNAAVQTLAVVVRGIALNQISLQRFWLVLKREVGASLINGLITGSLVALIVVIFNRDTRIAIILALALVMNLVVAAFFGTLVPLIMHRLNKDPASSATIFITTATDVLGFLAFLGLATLVLL